MYSVIDIRAVAKTGGFFLLSASFWLIMSLPALAAWPVDIIATGDTGRLGRGGFSITGNNPDLPLLLKQGDSFFSCEWNRDFILLMREEGQTVNRVEYGERLFNLHLVNRRHDFGFMLEFGRQPADALFVSDDNFDGFDINPRQWRIGLSGKLNERWSGGLLVHRQKGGSPFFIDSLVENLERFEPDQTDCRLDSQNTGFEVQLRRDGADGESVSFRLGHDDMSATMDIASPDESLSIPLPLKGWHSSLGYEKQGEDKYFTTVLFWASMEDLGRIIFNETLDLGPTHNSYRDLRAGCLWRFGPADGDSDSYGFSLGRTRLSSFGSADAVVFGGSIFGILSGRGHYDGNLKVDTLSMHYGHNWRLDGDFNLRSGLQVAPYRIDGNLTTYETAYFGTKKIDEETSKLDVNGGIIGSIGLGFTWKPSDDLIITGAACQLFPIYTNSTTEEQDQQPGTTTITSTEGGTLVSVNVSYLF